MLARLRKFAASNRETKLFLFTAILYTAGVLIPVIYCYARLDYVRSYEVPQNAPK